jgi:hypothetical protein
MLDFLGGGFLAPDPVALKTDRRERRRLEPDQVGHLHGQPQRYIDNPAQEIRVLQGFCNAMIGADRQGVGWGDSDPPS